MAREINSVAVCGSGTMGAGIAALCANAGLPVLFMDMPAQEGERNGIVSAAIQKMQGGRQPMLKDAESIARITIGNFEDDMSKIAGCDWIVEVIIEDLEIKRNFFTKLENVRSEGSIVTSNTSGIMLSAITERLPERLRRDIAVTHFFNPVLIMKLVELIPGKNTEQEVLDTLAILLSRKLGKGVVWGKDTVNFIANRIGCFWLLAGLNEAPIALDAGYSMEEIDASLSQPLGVPPTGLFGLADLVGIDVLGLVAENLQQNLAQNDIGLTYAKIPQNVQEMVERGQVGRKAGGGFYRMVKTSDGERLKEIFDLATRSWRASRVANLADDMQDPAGLLFNDGPLGRLAWSVMGGTLVYAADLIPEISEDVVNIDRAMRWGFNWRQGPFEMLDSLGPDRIIARLESEGRPIPIMLRTLISSGEKNFYRKDGKEFFGIDGSWLSVP